MIDRIELDVADHLENMRKLEGSYASLAEQDLESRDKVIDVRHMGQNVIGDDQIRRTALLAKPRRRL